MKEATTHLLLNGKPVSGHSLREAYSNRAFLYGDGFFESMRFENNRLLFADEHLHRIHRSMVLCELAAATFPDKEALEAHIAQLCQLNQTGAFTRARISIFRDSTGLYTPEDNNCSWLLQVNALEGTYRFPEEGLVTGIYTRQAKARGPFACLKSLSSQFYVMAALHAKKEKWDESLVLNTSGHIIEGTSSNVFLVFNNTLITAPLSEGCIDGVFRKYLLTIADKNGIPFREQLITETEVNLASEIILTNTVRGLRWVKRMGKQTYANKTARELFELIRSDLSETK